MSGPLTGIRILDFSNVVSGPMSVQILADQGADVIKIEQPDGGDSCRQMGAKRGGMSSMFAVLNRNKRSMVLDLKQDAAQDIVRKLVTESDVLVQNFRPGAMQRIGLDYAQVQALNPGLVYASISGFGADGPYANRRVYDPVIQAISGFVGTQKISGSQSLDLIKNIVCDKVTALTAAQAITAALFVRERSGVGQHLEVAMVDAGLAFLWPDGMWNHTYVGDGVQAMPALGDIYRLTQTADGYITTIIVSDSEWAGMCRALKCEAMMQDSRFKTLADRLANFDAFVAFLESEISNWKTDELCPRLDTEEVPFAKVNTLDEIADDPQIKHRQLIGEFDHRQAGQLRMPRPVARFGQDESSIRFMAPMLGEHSEQILSEMSYTPEQIAQFRTAGVIN